MTKFDLLQHASGSFLTDELPDNYEDLEDSERDDFLTEHAWEKFEEDTANTIWTHIENSADDTERFLLRQGLITEELI